MSVRKIFKTDDRLETKGIVIEYGTATRIRIARAGGANKKFARLLEQRTKHLRRALAVGAGVENEQALAILIGVYADSVVLNWEENVGTPDEPNWKQGISPEDVGQEGTDLVPFTPENVANAFRFQKDLFIDIQAQASSHALFKEEVDQAQLGN